MLRSTYKLRGYTIAAVDGDAGRLHDFLFEESTWRIRYAVAVLNMRNRLLAPAVLGNIDEDARTLAVGLNREQVEGCLPLPDETSARWAPEFATPRVSAAGSAPAPIDTDEAAAAMEPGPGPGLRSAQALKGYTILATNGEIGRIEDLIVDDEDWMFRYLLVDTRSWWPGGGVIVSTGWAREIVWAENAIRVDLTREAVRRSPPFDRSQPINREYERKLYEHYGNE